MISNIRKRIFAAIITLCGVITPTISQALEPPAHNNAERDKIFNTAVLNMEPYYLQMIYGLDTYGVDGRYITIAIALSHGDNTCAPADVISEPQQLSGRRGVWMLPEWDTLDTTSNLTIANTHASTPNDKRCDIKRSTDKMTRILSVLHNYYKDNMCGIIAQYMVGRPAIQAALAELYPGESIDPKDISCRDIRLTMPDVYQYYQDITYYWHKLSPKSEPAPKVQIQTRSHKRRRTTPREEDLGWMRELATQRWINNNNKR